MKKLLYLYVAMVCTLCLLSVPSSAITMCLVQRNARHTQSVSLRETNDCGKPFTNWILNMRWRFYCRWNGENRNYRHYAVVAYAANGGTLYVGVEDYWADGACKGNDNAVCCNPANPCTAGANHQVLHPVTGAWRCMDPTVTYTYSSAVYYEYDAAGNPARYWNSDEISAAFKGDGNPA